MKDQLIDRDQLPNENYRIIMNNGQIVYLKLCPPYPSILMLNLHFMEFVLPGYKHGCGSDPRQKIRIRTEKIHPNSPIIEINTKSFFGKKDIEKSSILYIRTFL